MFQRALSHCVLLQRDWQEAVFENVVGAPGLESGCTLRIDEQFARSMTFVQQLLRLELVWLVEYARPSSRRWERTVLWMFRPFVYQQLHCFLLACRKIVPPFRRRLEEGQRIHCRRRRTNLLVCQTVSRLSNRLDVDLTIIKIGVLSFWHTFFLLNWRVR